MSFLDSLWTRLKRRAFPVFLAIVLGALIMVNNEGSGRLLWGIICIVVITLLALLVDWLFPYLGR